MVTSQDKAARFAEVRNYNFGGVNFEGIQAIAHSSSSHLRYRVRLHQVGTGQARGQSK